MKFPAKAYTRKKTTTESKKSSQYRPRDFLLAVSMSDD